MHDHEPDDDRRSAEQHIGPGQRGQAQDQAGDAVEHDPGRARGAQQQPDEQQVEEDDQRRDQQLPVEEDQRPVCRRGQARDGAHRAAEQHPPDDEQQSAGQGCKTRLNDAWDVVVVAAEPVDRAQQRRVQRRPEIRPRFERLAGGNRLRPLVVVPLVDLGVVEDRAVLPLVQVHQPQRKGNRDDRREDGDVLPQPGPPRDRSRGRSHTPRAGMGTASATAGLLGGWRHASGCAACPNRLRPPTSAGA